MTKIKTLGHNERMTKKLLFKSLKKLDISMEDLDKDRYFWLVLATGSAQFEGDINCEFIRDNNCEKNNEHWFHLFEKDSGYKCKITLNRENGLFVYYDNKLLFQTNSFNEVLKLKNEWINRPS